MLDNLACFQTVLNAERILSKGELSCIRKHVPIQLFEPRVDAPPNLSCKIVLIPA